MSKVFQFLLGQGIGLVDVSMTARELQDRASIQKCSQEVVEMIRRSWSACTQAIAQIKKHSGLSSAF